MTAVAAGFLHWSGFAWTLVRTDFKARYHGTAAGFVWALAKPVAMCAVLSVVFSLIFVTRPAYALELIIGLFLWEFFAEATKTGLTSLHAKAFLLRKARFPSWIVVVTSIANPLITLLVFSTVIVVFVSVRGTPPSIGAVALFVLYLAAFTATVVGFCLAASVLFLHYRDLDQVWDVVVQAGFFVAPIIYPLDVLPERLHRIVYAWPPTPVIQFSRAVLVEGAVPSPTAHVCLVASAAVALLIGAFVFRLGAPRAAERL